MQTPPFTYVVHPIEQAPERHVQPWREWEAHVDAGRIATTRLTPDEIAAATAMEALFRHTGICRR
jgi:hypothetical protein